MINNNYWSPTQQLNSN